MANTKPPSTEEIWMQEYFKELQENGFIREIIYQPTPFVLSEEVKCNVQKLLKTKIKFETKTLISKHIYTCDYQIQWMDENIFHEDISNDYFFEEIPLFISNRRRSFIEVKANYDTNNMTRHFNSALQPWLYQQYQIYINLVKLPQIFKDSFIPKSILHNFYYKKDVYIGKGDKKILKARAGDPKFSWKYYTLEEYINEKTA